MLPIEPVPLKLDVGNFKKKMDEINPLSKFLSPLISFICSKDTISVPGIICGTIWGSFPVLGSFAVQFGDHLRYWDHLRAGIICGAVQAARAKTKNFLTPSASTIGILSTLTYNEFDCAALLAML